MHYSQGDTIVHPQHGTAVVEGVVVRDLGQGPTEYLQLYIDPTSLTILLPSLSVEQAGLRPLASRQDAEAILALLREDADVPTEWAERNTSTVVRMKSRELDQVAMVVRDLTRHQQRLGRSLNGGEHAALNAGLNLLARELSLSLGMTEDETRALLTEQAAGAGAVSRSPGPGTSPDR